MPPNNEAPSEKEQIKRYGGFWIRVVAALIDVFLIFAAVIAVVYVFGTPKAIEISEFTPLEYTRATRDYLGDLGNVTLFILWFFYPAIMASSKHQATVGKLCAGLVVVDEREKRLSFWRAAAREFAKFLSIVFNGAGYLMIAFNRRKRGLHDVLTKTFVLKKTACRHEPPRATNAMKRDGK